MGSLAVITFADTRFYRRGIKRIEEGLDRFGFVGDFIPYTRLPTGCPDHRTAPYGFKAFCLLATFERGYEQVLYLDASTVILKPVGEIFDVISTKGYYLHESPDDSFGTIGRYCSDDALKLYGVERSDVMMTKYHTGSFYGLSSTNICHKFLQGFREHCFDGSLSYAGGRFDSYWKLHRTDARQQGHRQQSVTTLLAIRLGMSDASGLASVRPFNHETYDPLMIHEDSVLWSDRHFVKRIPML